MKQGKNPSLPRTPWRRGALVVMVAVLLWLVLAVVATGIGAVRLPAGTIVRMMAERWGWPGIETDWSPAFSTILFQIRLPRIVLGSVVGAVLAVSGATLQALFRNPMADPYTLGVSSGAALGAVTAMVTGFGLSVASIPAVPVTAFVGALATVAVVYALARFNGRITTTSLLLAGIAVGSFLSAIVSLLLVYNEQQASAVIFWLMGSLARADWTQTAAMMPLAFLGLAWTGLHTRHLNALLLGDEAAHHLGIHVERVRRHLLVAVSLMTAAAVSVTGIIGFVGLIVPHTVRLLFGPDHRLLVPLSALGGAIFLLAADTAARTIVAPAELPVGVITALCGAPFFLWLLRRTRGGHRPA